MSGDPWKRYIDVYVYVYRQRTRKPCSSDVHLLTISKPQDKIRIRERSYKMFVDFECTFKNAPVIIDIHHSLWDFCLS